MLEVKNSVLEMDNSFGRPKRRLDTAEKRQNLKTGQEAAFRWKHSKMGKVG